MTDKSQANSEPFGLTGALIAVAEGNDLDYITYHGLTHREVIQAYVESFPPTKK